MWSSPPPIEIEAQESRNVTSDCADEVPCVEYRVIGLHSKLVESPVHGTEKGKEMEGIE
jgi:hypothetical protein